MTNVNNLRNNQALYMLEIIERRLKSKEYECAIECCDWLISINEYIVDAHFIKGCVLYQIENFAKSEEEILKALISLPHTEENISNLLRTAIKASDSPIHEMLSYSAEFFQSSSAVNILFGILLAKEGRYNEAFLHFRKAKSINPNNPHLYINIGTAMLSRKNITMHKCRQAVCCLSRALKVLPLNRSALYNRCRAWIKLGVAENAITDSKTLLFLDNDDPSFNYIHAKAHLVANDFDEAKIYFTRALELANNDYVKKESIKQLNKLKRMKK